MRILCSIPILAFALLLASGSLQDLGGSGCTSSSPCSLCQGDCDSDADCIEGLFCYQRDVSTDAVPGCDAGGPGDIGTHDYCYDPNPDVEAWSTVSEGQVVCSSQRHELFIMSLVSSSCFPSLDAVDKCNEECQVRCSGYRYAEVALALCTCFDQCSFADFPTPATFTIMESSPRRQLIDQRPSYGSSAGRRWQFGDRPFDNQGGRDVYSAQPDKNSRTSSENDESSDISSREQDEHRLFDSQGGRRKM